jgi:hypothetical protein
MLRVEAEVLFRRFQFGLAERDELVSWADSWIERLDSPPYPLIELSLARSKSDYHVTQCLKELIGGGHQRQVWKQFIEHLLRLVAQDPSRDSEVARILFLVALEGDVPDGVPENQMLRYWDDIDLAKNGVYGNRESERTRLIHFLENQLHSE